MLKLLLTSEHVFHANIDCPTLARGKGQEISFEHAPVRPRTVIANDDDTHIISSLDAGNGSPASPGHGAGQQPGSPGAPPPSLPGGGFSPHPPMVSMDPGHKPGTLPPITAPLAGLLQPPPPEPPPAPPGTNSLAAIMAIIEPEWRGRVRTGMDVVEYFAANGHGARVKMMHAVRSDLTGTDCPYELVVTAKEVIAGDYYTMSASGVVHMHADGSPAEFTPIGDWVREHSVFNMMKQLPFFRTYMAHRMFRKWRKAARQQAFEKVRKALELRLFLAKPDFCFTLMDLRSKAHELRSLPLVEPEEQAQPLHDFAAQAAELRK
ncbi:uncharacterized protein HaLaN_07502 [Haematococcus lacustris]|uniref:Uncharacterized protein n=1 Tax=Haematococcus lacustris TaxID=44745 RepID=A0A699YNR0_HAELA|nr:uncharacterized protein HaLaN_07502 [Haematococcus lacustris]